MTKKEQQNIAKSMYKTVQQLRIKREDKFEIYYAMVSGLAMADEFSEDYLLDYDVILNEALAAYKRRNKNKLIATT